MQRAEACRCSNSVITSEPLEFKRMKASNPLGQYDPVRFMNQTFTNLRRRNAASRPVLASPSAWNRLPQERALTVTRRATEPNVLRVSSAKSQSPIRDAIFTGKIEDYSLGKVIGKGAYAAVRQGTHRLTSGRVAVKTYEKYKLADPTRKHNVKREALIMKNLNHPHTIRLLDSIENSRQIHLVMEYVGGSSLHNYLKRRSSRRLDEAEARRLFRQLVCALDYCHKSEVIHRDIKLENVLLDEKNNVKLIDFGFSTTMPHGNKSKTFCGTPSYMAPEIVARSEYLGPPVDVWALGVLLFAMLAGSFPFRGITEKELYRKIAKGSFEVPDCVPLRAKNLIKRMIQLDPLRRPSCSELLTDSWLSEVRGARLPNEEYSAPLSDRQLIETLSRNELRHLGRPLSVISPKIVSRAPSYLDLVKRHGKENTVNRP